MALLIPTTLAEDLPDLAVTSLTRTRNGPLNYTIYYVLRNCGDADLVGATFTDAGYQYEDGDWNQIAQSIITHTNYSLAEDTYSGTFSYTFYPRSGVHAYSQWTDIYNNVEEKIESNNNYITKYLWNWY